MPVTYYTAEEFDTLKRNMETQVNQLCYEIKNLRGEKCNMLKEFGDAITDCGRCQFHHYNAGPKCTSNSIYLSK